MLSSEKLAFVILFILLTIVYNVYLYKSPDEYDETNDSIIKEFLLSNGTSTNKIKIWIHIPTEYNSLYWESFGSRTNTNVNVDYLYLCMQSIIQHNKQSELGNFRI